MEPSLIELPKFFDRRGNLSFIEEDNQLPFKIRRVYWIYDVPGGEIRGGHAFRETEELIVALSGSFDVILHDGNEQVVFHLNRSYYGVMVPKMFWRSIENFSTNSLALIIASTDFDDADYIRDFLTFKSLKSNG
ncbi:MAG: WxcM-like domain-containing protein [Bacteroidales bacterium]|jgi:oxalate decarboxylase/phosphoglucose isomerase-like protein (cupin superfamily)|nr:WxcM-like domain-containing protein [Bacteroidales bacterium]MZP53885.1 WxcM-like domain-containing protein [Bacteroidales bacterium]HPY66814.1 FdtA/QdtA family cupin domain-containing protein [Bacteroidales bacterium]HQB35958.1 FdtA/QdtA family cupin domain-containing protein [Bacteroidales bacterium]